MASAANDPSASLEAFLEAFCAWAVHQPGLLAAALCGSQARGSARPDSDVDLVLIAADPPAWLADTRWVGSFGQPRQMQVESYGRLTSLRVWYAGGLEVEYGIAGQDWAALPPDPGTRQVVAGGFRVLFERTPLLSLLLKEITSGK